MTVQQVIDAIIRDSEASIPLNKTCDQLMAGSFDAEVTGIVTTFMATVEVIREAKRLGANLVITHEPTYFTGVDRTDWLVAMDDRVYREKQALIAQTGVNIWRYHDHMHMKKGDAIYDGLLERLGWREYLMPDLPHPHGFVIPQTSVRALCAFFKRELDMDTIQIVGDPNMPVSRVGILVGGGSLGLGREEMPMEFMHKQNLDVLVCGEILEWTLCAYVNDARQLGMNRAMIVLGHERSEEWGMEHMERWLPALTPGIPVRFVDAKEPFLYL